MFKNRGEMPNINPNIGGNDNGGMGYRVPHYSHYWNGRFIVVHYDKTFVAIELIVTIIILLIVGAVYLFAYQVTFDDPIATIKNNFLTAQLVSIVVSLAVTGLVTFFTKSSKENLIKNLRIVAILSILIFIVLFGIKLNIDYQYNEQSKSNNKNSNTITFGLSGVKISTLKEAYISESVNAYTNFSVKAILYMAIHILLIIVIFYLSYRLSAIERKREKLAKDDAILYDEEENVKY